MTRTFSYSNTQNISLYPDIFSSQKYTDFCSERVVCCFLTKLNVSRRKGSESLLF